LLSLSFVCNNTLNWYYLDWINIEFVKTKRFPLNNTLDMNLLKMLTAIVVYYGITWYIWNK
jgi:hypothetical protein